jgi:hypothetical protein
MALAALLGVGVGTPSCASSNARGSGDAGGDVGIDASPGCKAKAADPMFKVPSSCGVDTPLVVGGQDTGYATCAGGAIHRRSIAACPDLIVKASPGSCPSMGSGFCQSDADCTDTGLHAACSHNDAGYCSCSSGCVADTDCPMGQVCQCGPTIGTCTPARCAEDSDCGEGLLCVLADIGQPMSCNSCGQTFVCQTTSDTCLSNDACPSGCGMVSSCILIGDQHTCSAACLTAVGRPFLVGRQARVAPVIDRHGWRDATTPSVSLLSARDRRLLADVWEKRGQMEHASVAAFARFVLELLALGAPAELVRSSQRAMSDEIDHAERAFALASAYRGRPVGPGALDIEGAMEKPTVESVIVTLLREGCIGETLAAVEAAEALEHATDKAVRATLEVVVEDETRHAALAWVALEWLLDSRGAELRSWSACELEQAIRECEATSTSIPEEDEDGRADHGVIGARRQNELRSAALKRLVAPKLSAIRARPDQSATRSGRVCQRALSQHVKRRVEDARVSGLLCVAGRSRG